MRTYNKIGDCIEEIGNDWDISVTLSYTNNEGQHNKNFSKNNTLEVFQKYWDWVLISYNNLSGYDALNDAWENFINLNKERYNRLFWALDEKYNPLYNYDKDSVISVQHTGTIDHDKGTTQSTHYGTKTDTMTAPETWTKNEDGAYNSNGNVIQSNKITNSGGTGSTTTNEHNDDITWTGSDSDVFNNTDTTTEKTFGNIGTTKSSDMVLAEIEVRRHEILHTLINDFMCDNGFLCVDSEY